MKTIVSFRSFQAILYSLFQRLFLETLSLNVSETSHFLKSTDFLQASNELERKLIGISDEDSERVKTFEDGKQN